MKKIWILPIVAILAFSLTSCDEDIDTVIGTPTDEDMQPVADNAKTEKGLMTATSYMNPYGLDEDLSTKKGADDPTYNLVGVTLTIDFSEVEGMDGVIVVEYSSNPLDSPLTAIDATTTLQNFAIGNTTYNGVLSFAYTNTGDEIAMTVSTIDGDPITITEGSSEITWDGTRSLTWIQGISTPIDITDDLYEVTGSAEGIASTLTNYTTEVLSALVLSPNCDYIMGGEQELINNVGTDDQTSMTMNYSVDSNGNDLSEPTCNSYVKMHFVSSTLDVNIVINLDNL